MNIGHGAAGHLRPGTAVTLKQRVWRRETRRREAVRLCDENWLEAQCVRRGLLQRVGMFQSTDDRTPETMMENTVTALVRARPGSVAQNVVGRVACPRPCVPRCVHQRVHQCGRNIESQFEAVLAVRGALDENFSIGPEWGGRRACLERLVGADASTHSVGGALRREERNAGRRKRGSWGKRESGKAGKRECPDAVTSRRGSAAYCSPCRRSTSSRRRINGSLVSSSAQVSRSSMARWQPSSTRSRSTGTPLASANWIVSANCWHSSSP